MTSIAEEFSRDGNKDAERPDWLWAIPIFRERDHTVKAWTLVSEEDFDWARRPAWKVDAYGYAVHTIYLGGGKGNPIYEKTRLHRLVCCLYPGDKRVADHINGDKLDNRRDNLRVVTQAENAQNCNGRRSDLPRGVTLAKSGRYYARCGHDGKDYRSGPFATVEEAAKGAAELRRQHLPFADEGRHAA